MPRPEWLKIINGVEDDGEPVDILMDGTIGGRVTSDGYQAYLSTLPKNKRVNLFINSLGGYIDTGTTIHSINVARGNVHTIVAGYAASMASVIAQSGETRQMMPGTMMIIHNPQAPNAGGEEKDLELQLSMIKKAKANIIDIYQQSTGLSRKKLSDMMDATTCMTPEDALEIGFIDSIYDTKAMKNKIEISPTANLSSVLRSVGSLEPVSEGEEVNNKQKGKTVMKSLIAALAAVGLLPSPDMTDEATIVTAVNGNLSKFTNSADKTKITDLEAKLKRQEDAQKARVTAKVKAAIETEKLVKEDRKDRLVNMGTEDEQRLDEYLEDLRSMKASAAPAPGTPPVTRPRNAGAPPVPPEAPGNEGRTADEQKIIDLKAEMTGASASRKVEIARELRSLRGHKNMFAEPASK